MPAHRTIFGMPLPTGLLPRRVTVLLGFVVVFAISTLLILVSFSTSSSVTQVQRISDHSPQHLSDRISTPKLPKLSAPKFRNPFRHPVHAPPVQANSTSGEAKWYSNWRWLNPFSSSITLDENRSVLPPLRTRPPVYTFYDAQNKKDKASRAAEGELLLVWRRAWWAQGFKPIVLGRAEATNNPLYESLQSHQLDPGIELELFKWLAWEHMGAGILLNWLTIPMGSFEDPLLTYLRRGDYPVLTRYEGLGSGLLSGNKVVVTTALKQTLYNKELNRTKSILDAFPKDAFRVDPPPRGIALYGSNAVKTKYEPVHQKIASEEASGLRSLAQLITSHLQTTFQNAFPDGIAVLNPLQEHTSVLVRPALKIAKYLAECTESPMPASCPPNRPTCEPCVSSRPLPILTPSVFQNASTLYTIGTVPHPYTLTTLSSQRDSIDIAYIRRKTERDPWLIAATKELLGTGVGTGPRLLKFKEAVASEWGIAHSLWLIPEKDVPADLDWHFGFTIPKNVTDRGFATPPVPGSKPVNPSAGFEETPISESELQREKWLLDKAKGAVQSRIRQLQPIREAVEAWNLGDTEAWRFARAFAARSRVEREKWEEEEKKFEGSTGTWARWLDGFRS
ncbi:MAG: hypothetical protein M1816_006224 [Peltula sp. TS41687]|nr:MAG: hypothetical protein M1816_006224 [Peltula sp. TS41687]